MPQNPFIKFGFMAFQMLAVILVFTWLGQKSCHVFNYSIKTGWIIGSLTGTVISIVLTLRQLK